MVAVGDSESVVTMLQEIQSEEGADAGQRWVTDAYRAWAHACAGDDGEALAFARSAMEGVEEGTELDTVLWRFVDVLGRGTASPAR
jgi:hypothetical protein